MAERRLNADLCRFKREMSAFFNGDRFHRLWRVWMYDNDVFGSPDEIGESIETILKESFAIVIPSLHARLYASLISQLRTLYATYQVMLVHGVEYGMYGFQVLCQQSIDHAIHTIGDVSGRRMIEQDSLYDRCCATYQTQFDAASIIQSRWLRAICDPAFAICKRRLYREWKEMSNVLRLSTV